MVKARKSSTDSSKCQQNGAVRSEVMTRTRSRDNHCGNYRRGVSPERCTTLNTRSNKCTRCCSPVTTRRSHKAKLMLKDSSNREPRASRQKPVTVGKLMEIEEEVMTTDMNEVLLTCQNSGAKCDTDAGSCKQLNSDVAKYASHSLASRSQLKLMPTVEIEKLDSSCISSLSASSLENHGIIENVVSRIKTEPEDERPVICEPAVCDRRAPSDKQNTETVKAQSIREKSPSKNSPSLLKSHSTKPVRVIKKILFNNQSSTANGTHISLFQDVPVKYFRPLTLDKSKTDTDRILSVKNEPIAGTDVTLHGYDCPQDRQLDANSEVSHTEQLDKSVESHPINAQLSELVRRKSKESGKRRDHRKKLTSHAKRGRQEVSGGLSGNIKMEPVDTSLTAHGKRTDILLDSSCDDGSGSSCKMPRIAKNYKLSAKSESKLNKSKQKPKSFLCSITDVLSSSLKQPVLKIPGLNSSSLLDDGIKRRRNVEEEVFTCRRLEQQACILWSSEQKRRFQQQNPDAGSETLDNIMRHHWENLSERDRHRYMHRARSAMSVERSRQLSRRGLTQQLSSKDDALLKEASLVRRLQHCTPLQITNLFNSCTAEHQADIIHHKLWSLQRRLSDIDYQRLTRQFSANLLAARDQNYLDMQQQLQSGDRSTFDKAQKMMEEHARRVMFQTVVDMEAKVEDIVTRRMASVQWQTKAQYDAIVSSLIQDPTVPVPPDDCFSARLEQLLKDLDDLENDINDQYVKWNRKDEEAISCLETELSRGWFAGSTTMSIDGQNVTVPNITNGCYLKSLLVSSAYISNIQPLSPEDIDAFLLSNSVVGDGEVMTAYPSEVLLVEAAGHVYRLLHGYELCCSLDSPSCVLSTLLVHDRLRRLEESNSLSYSSSAADSAVPTSEFRPPARRCTARRDHRLDAKRRGTDDRLSTASRRSAARESVKACGSNEGIFGFDSWLTNPIETAVSDCSTIPAQLSSAPDSSGQTNIAIDRSAAAATSENWPLQDDHTDYSLLSLLHESHEITSG